MIWPWALDTNNKRQDFSVSNGFYGAILFSAELEHDLAWVSDTVRRYDIRFKRTYTWSCREATMGEHSAVHATVGDRRVPWIRRILCCGLWREFGDRHARPICMSPFGRESCLRCDTDLPGYFNIPYCIPHCMPYFMPYCVPLVRQCWVCNMRGAIQLRFYIMISL
jgi:hypothetical protein